MKAKIKSFQSGMGDCIFFILIDEEQEYHIMIDCGEYTTAIKDYVENVLKKKIDLLVVTHIDADHILGVERMLDENADLIIEKIVFNCYERSDVQSRHPLTLSQKARINSIKSEVNCVFVDVVENAVSAPQAVKGLAMSILDNPSWARVWERGYVALDAKNEIDLGKIRFLAPTMEEITGLDTEFRSLLFNELFVDDDNVQIDDFESLYEMLIRYTELHNEGAAEERPIAGQTLEERLRKASRKDAEESRITISNKASLAFVWENHEKRVLFLGDAKPSIVVNGLLTHYPNGLYPMMFEVVKVAHHGSHYNTTEALMSLIDSEHFFITGGEEGKRPSESALGRILLRTCNTPINKRTLHVNYKTSLLEELARDTTLQAMCHFDIDFDQNEHEFTV